MPCKKIKVYLKLVLWLISSPLFFQSTLANAQSMVHITYTGSTKINFDGMAAQDYFKKNCDETNQQYIAMGKPSLVKPFKVTGSFKDLEVYTENVYISPENSYHAIYKSGYKINGEKMDVCNISIIPRQENTIVHYAQHLSYEFDSSRTNGEQWVKNEIPNATTSKLIVGTLAGQWRFKLSAVSKKDMIAGLFCEIRDFSMGKKNEMLGSACLWRSTTKDHLMFVGHPLELALSTNTQVGKGVLNSKVADSVNLREAYNSSVFQVPNTLKNKPFYADEPSYTKPEKDDSNLDCKAEKKKTGIDPCSSPADLAKWCKAELDKTGEDRCNNDDINDENK